MSCSNCDGQCPVPTACQQPEPRRTLRPDFTVSGPYRRNKRRFHRAARWVAELAIVTAAVGALSFTFGALGRYFGVL